ncbi:MAG: hypothetical protein CL608_22930 [Anaerolineaceae bacterium]|nr:hypothetical protein [Anaerolineaceae bacterium]
MNRSNSNLAENTYNQRLLVGLAILCFIFVFAIGFALVSLIKQDRQQAQYPGSIPIASHSSYKSLPRSYRWHDTFRTDDGFRAVYEWYSLKFNTGAESRANGSCILLESDDAFFRVERYVSVEICGTPEGQMVFVSRTTTFK